MRPFPTQSLYLHITYSGAGGMTEAVLTLVEAAVREARGRHYVLFFGADDLPERIRRRCEAGEIPCTFIHKGPGSDWPSQARIARLLHQLQPAVIFSHMTESLPALLRHRLVHPRCRIISIEHHSNALKSPQDWLLTCANHHLADRTVYLTPEYKEQIQARLGPILRPRKISIIPNGIDTRRFAPSPHEPPSPPYLLGMAARMVPGKDFETLLRAAALLARLPTSPPFRLHLAGDGPLSASFSALALELGLAGRVSFLGLLPQNALVEEMRSWHVFVLSTLGETMSRSIMEAQALGLPILATRVSGVTSSIASHEDGVLVPPRDPEAMAQALHGLLTDASLRQRLGRAAREKAVLQYSAEQSWHRYLELSDSVLSR